MSLKNILLSNNSWRKTAAFAGGLILFPPLLIEALVFSWTKTFSLDHFLAKLILSFVSIAFVLITIVIFNRYQHLKPAWFYVVFIGVIIFLIIFYTLFPSTPAAWILASLLFILFNLQLISIPSRSIFLYLLAAIILTILISTLFVSIVEVETAFSDEEFYIIPKILLLEIFGLSNAFVCRYLIRPITPPIQLYKTIWRLSLNSFTILCLLFVSGIAAGWIIGHYQHSFYPQTSPKFTGISASKPFLCTTVSPSAQSYTSEEVFQQLIAAIERHPNKSAPEYGHLALSTHKSSWAQLFRETLLNEARNAEFTRPANSVKYDQYLASFRVYYFHEVNEAFPGLFSVEEQQLIRSWFQEINRRAMTVEWVDWLYAIAFAKMPEGPYENQENGAGLLSLLEAYDYSDPSLSTANLAYLNSRKFGWNFRFRNNDDVLGYQIEWLTNAYFHSLFNPNVNHENQKRSYQWLLMQTLPDGAPYSYNSPYPTSLASVAYQGAVLLQDPELLWIAGRSLEYLAKTGQYLSALPGAEKPLPPMRGTSPTVGSCVIFSESGLPNQKSEYTPDKLIIRDGWNPDSTFLLVNLRFTGWHRYKGTNTIVLLYQNHPIIWENIQRETNDILPKGRSLMRDKRLSRENLNGLSVGREGLDLLLQQITSVESPWAQDPPHYVSDIEFTNTIDGVYSKVTMERWHGWSHTREIYLCPGKALILVDHATGQRKLPAMLSYSVDDQYSPPLIKIYKVLNSNLTPIDITSTLKIKEENGTLTTVTILPLGDWSVNPDTINVTLDKGKLRISNEQEEIMINRKP